MGTLLHFKNLYLEAFDDCKPSFVVLFYWPFMHFCTELLLALNSKPRDTLFCKDTKYVNEQRAHPVGWALFR